jgi:predicted nucleotidyltransferase
MLKKSKMEVPTPKQIAKLVLRRDFSTDGEALRYIQTHAPANKLVRDGLNRFKDCDTRRGPLAPPTGAISMLEVAEIVFERPFRSATALTSFLDNTDKDFMLSFGLSLAGWVPKHKRQDKITKRTADALLRTFIAGVDAANANTKLCYFVERITLFGSYLRRAQHVTDIDVCISYVRKTSAKLDQTIRRYIRLKKVDDAEAYNCSL